MLIKKLILSNNNNKQAKIEFFDGINIISGVSNTGKTFIYQCINYILCSDTACCFCQNIHKALTYVSV